jgi:hypothetical protein
MATPPIDTTLIPGHGLEDRVAGAGRTLGEALRDVVERIPGRPEGPQRLAEALGLDKVLASRLLKCLRQSDPIAIVHHAPGPEPLRRLLRAARSRGVPAAVVSTAEAAVQAFEDLIRREAGDRSALLAVLAAWLPEARQEFELRRKQTAYRAMSQLKGASAETSLGTVLLHPNPDGTTLDVVWLLGILGLRRLRPGAVVRLTTRRQVEEVDAGREPRNLAGDLEDGADSLRLDDFCHATPATIEVTRGGDVVHYLLGETGFGPRSEVDLLLAEVNLAEMPRYVAPEHHRRGYTFTEVSLPVRRMLFDVFLHEDVYPGQRPELLVYDTVPEGVANVNDPARDVDRLETTDTVHPIVSGVDGARTAEVPRYREMLGHVFDRMAWDPSRFRGFRCRVEYPIYGTQVCMAFDPPAPPESSD